MRCYTAMIIHYLLLKYRFLAPSGNFAIRKGGYDCKHFGRGACLCAGLRKKLTAASKTAGCKDLTQWVNTVCNHLWWCTTASGGDGELLAAVWLSVTNHVCDIHVDHGPVYPRCMHKDLGEKQWIAPGL